MQSQISVMMSNEIIWILKKPRKIYNDEAWFCYKNTTELFSFLHYLLIVWNVLERKLYTYIQHFYLINMYNSKPTTTFQYQAILLSLIALFEKLFVPVVLGTNSYRTVIGYSLVRRKFWPPLALRRSHISRQKTRWNVLRNFREKRE